MPSWYIEPRDPLIVRDGRPFGADPGARAHSLSFPIPSTTSGGLRNRAGLNNAGVFEPTRIDEVLKIAVRGPLLAMLDQAGQFTEWLPPAPADAHLLPGANDSEARVIQLVPLQKRDESCYSSPLGGEDLALVGPEIAIEQKPLANPPRFWHWQLFKQWLIEPQQQPFSAPVATDTLGIKGPQLEYRTHVSIQPNSQTAEEGRLFQTSGLEFTSSDRSRLALVIESDAELKHFANGGFAPLGGERRLMAWRPNAPAFPACPPDLRKRIITERGCRVILLTPAHFAAGYRPTWLLDAHRNVKAELAAVLIQRPQVISGWDMQEGKPKPTRRLAPSGSVFFLRLPEKEKASDEQVSAWIDAIWMQNISDDYRDNHRNDRPVDAERDRRDGFGLAVLGTWNRELTTM